jgi:hypothetical protein
MTDDCRLALCHECKQPLTAIDCYGEWLTGCMTWAPNGAKKWLPEEDFRALHQMMRNHPQ